MSEKNQVNKNIFTVVNHQSRNRLGISILEYCIADSIYHLSNNPASKMPGWSYIGQDTLGLILGVDRRTILRNQKGLVVKGLIERKGQLLRITKKWYDVVVLDDSIKVTKCHSEKGQNVTFKSDKMSPNSNTNKDKNKGNDSQSSSLILLGGRRMDDPVYEKVDLVTGDENVLDARGWPRRPKVERRESKSNVAKRIQQKFAAMCLEKLKVKVMIDNLGYIRVLYAMNNGGLTEEQIYKLFSDWFKMDNYEDDMVQLPRALSNSQINGFKARHRIKN